VAPREAVVKGWSRVAPGPAIATTVRLEPEGFSVAVGEASPWWAAYRDLERVGVDEGTVAIEVGHGATAQRLTFERFGPTLGTLARGLRDGRLRQWLTDGLLELTGSEPIELVEFAAGAMGGIASLLYHPRGVALAPLDERLPRFAIRRADIGAVSAAQESGEVRIEGAAGPLARGRVPAEATVQDERAIDTLVLSGLGAMAEGHRLRWTAVRDSAAADLAAIVATLLPDAPFDVRRRASSALIEGRPVDAAMLGDAWSAVEAGVLADASFAESYRTLLARAGGDAAARWLAMAPPRPGDTDDARIWFLIGLPGNLVALELVSAGAHATYLFRVVPRAAYVDGTVDRTHLTDAVRVVSEALVDARFLREPVALPAERLAEPRYARYRLALAALPSLAAARERFVARIVHADPASWAAALDDLIRWHGSERDEEATWPGRAGQEATIGAAGPADEGTPD
jgi:hypothetical protein